MANALVSGLFWYFVMGQTLTFAMTVAVSVPGYCLSMCRSYDTDS